MEAYFRRLHDPDPAIRLQAARDFHDWEWALFTVVGDESPSAQWLDPTFQLARARIVTHYFRHQAWLENDHILHHVKRLMGIPGILIHGRLDVGSPLASAWELAQAWPDSELIIVSGAGHSIATQGWTRPSFQPHGALALFKSGTIHS